MDDPGEDDDKSSLYDEQDDRVLWVIMSRVSSFEDTALRRCSSSTGS